MYGLLHERDILKLLTASGFFSEILVQSAFHGHHSHLRKDFQKLLAINIGHVHIVHSRALAHIATSIQKDLFIMGNMNFVSLNNQESVLLLQNLSLY